MSDAVLSASINDNNGLDKFQSSDRFSRSRTQSSKYSPLLQAGKQLQTGSSVENIEPVPLWVNYKIGGRTQLQCSQTQNI
jgi:hypothetical protein